MLLAGCTSQADGHVLPPAQPDPCKLLRDIPYTTGDVIGLVEDRSADAFPGQIPPGVLSDAAQRVEAAAAASDSPDAPVPVIMVFLVGGPQPGPDVVWPLDFPASGDTVREGQRRTALQCLENEVSALTPKKPGSPILQRINEASAAEPDMQILHVDTNGLQNMAPFDLRVKGVPGSPPVEVARKLHDAGQLHDLAGLPTVFHHLGVTAAGRLDEPQVDWLTATWLEICRVSNGTCSTDTEVAPMSDAPATVDVPDDPVDLGGAWVLSMCDITQGITASALFKASTAELLPGATDQIAAIVATLLQHPELHADLYGNSAMDPTSTEQGRYQISLERATTVERLLVDAGIDDNRLESYGLGATKRLVEDVGPDGQLIEEQARKNRRVDVTYRCPN